MRPEIENILKDLKFIENTNKPGLYEHIIDAYSSAYVDFRKSPEKGRRFLRVGDNIDADPDSVEVLKTFKELRDQILMSQGTETKDNTKSSLDAGQKEETFLDATIIHTSPSPVKNGTAPTSNLLKVIKEDYEADILEIFGDSGACKTKLAVLLALEGKRDGKKVRFVDTERNLRKSEIAALGDSYQYLPGIPDLNTFCKNIPKEPDVIIIDSIGYPILTEFAKMTANQKGTSLLNMIAWFGDLKEWAINNNKLVIVTNQPDSDFGKALDYVNRPFGDKARFAAKEIWELKRLGMKQGVTTSNILTFRSRIKGYGLAVAQIQVNDNGTTIKGV